MLSCDNLHTQDPILLTLISNHISEQLPLYLLAQPGKGRLKFTSGCRCSRGKGKLAPSSEIAGEGPLCEGLGQLMGNPIAFYVLIT